MATAFFYQANNVTTRNGIIYFRMRVPKILQPVFQNLTEFTLSLGITDRLLGRTIIQSYRAEIKKIVLALRIRAITAQLAKQLIENLLYGGQNEPLNALISPTASITSTHHHQPATTKLLKHAIDEFIEFKKHKCRERTHNSYIASCNIIDAKFGKVLVHELTPAIITTWRNALARTSAPYANKHIALLSSIFKMCIQRGYCGINPAAGLMIAIEETNINNNHVAVDDEENDRAYTDGELIKIINQLLETQDPYGKRPERFWVPFIAMFSGMRLDEICQLHVSDIKAKYDETAENNKIIYFDINDDLDKKLKNKHSKRKVPVHPFLLQWGLAEYVYEKQQQGQERLFKNLKKTQVGYSNAIQKWYRRWNAKYITTEPKKTFHSMRHSFANALKQGRIEPTLVSEILGHKVSSITMKLYSSVYSLKTRFDAISTVVYDAEKMTFKSILHSPELTDTSIF